MKDMKFPPRYGLGWNLSDPGFKIQQQQQNNHDNDSGNMRIVSAITPYTRLHNATLDQAYVVPDPVGTTTTATTTTTYNKSTTAAAEVAIVTDKISGGDSISTTTATNTITTTERSRALVAIERSTESTVVSFSRM